MLLGEKHPAERAAPEDFLQLGEGAGAAVSFPSRPPHSPQNF